MVVAYWVSSRTASVNAGSSRNIYLTPEQRRAARVVYRALCRASELWRAGERNAQRIRLEVHLVLASEPLVERIDYVSVADTATLDELDTVQGKALLSVAVQLGRPRLIDNIILE